jgi:hypothetical protein
MRFETINTMWGDAKTRRQLRGKYLPAPETELGFPDFQGELARSDSKG